MKTSIKSSELISSFTELTKSPEYINSTQEEKNEFNFNHKMKLNTYIYAEKFGILFADEFITDEEIAETERLEKEIAEIVSETITNTYKPAKKQASMSNGNMSHLFN